MTLAELIAVLLTAAAAILSGWLGIRLSRRLGFVVDGRGRTGPKLLAIALSLSVLWVALWFTSDSLLDASTLVLGFIFSIFAVVIIFRGNVRA